MTGLELGLSRKLIEINDWRGLPIPDEILKPNYTPWKKVVDLEQHLRGGCASILARDSKTMEEELNLAIFLLYGFSEQETVLVQDTLRYTIDAYLDRKTSAFNMPLSSVEQLRLYAERVSSQLNGMLKHIDQELKATLCIFPNDTPLRACHFQIRQLVGHPSIDTVHVGGIEDVLGQMAKDLQTEVADNLYVQRDLRVYDTDGFWIIKSAEARLWSQAAALNDADMIVQEHLEAIAL